MATARRRDGCAGARLSAAVCVLGRGVCVMDGWRLVPEKSNLNTLRWDKEGKDPVFWDRTCPRDAQEEPPLVVGGLLLDGAWRSTLGPKLTCKGRVASFVGYGDYPITLKGCRPTVRPCRARTGGGLTWAPMAGAYARWTAGG